MCSTATLSAEQQLREHLNVDYFLICSQPHLLIPCNSSGLSKNRPHPPKKFDKNSLGPYLIFVTGTTDGSHGEEADVEELDNSKLGSTKQ